MEMPVKPNITAVRQLLKKYPRRHSCFPDQAVRCNDTAASRGCLGSRDLISTVKQQDLFVE